MPPFSDDELLAYIAEQLPLARTQALEQSLACDQNLRRRLERTLAQSDTGGLTLGDLWRQLHLSCPTEAVWAGYLAGTLGDGLSQYLQFHLAEIGCRHCAATVTALGERTVTATDDPDPSAAPNPTNPRARRIFANSVGRLSEAARPPSP